MTVGCPECGTTWDDDAHYLPGAECPACGTGELQPYGHTSLPHVNEVRGQ